MIQIWDQYSQEHSAKEAYGNSIVPDDCDQSHIIRGDTLHSLTEAVRERLALLLDEGTFVEDGLLANTNAEDLPADGVVTGTGRIEGRPACVIANDPTGKAGSWGARTVEKIVRMTEHAIKHELPIVWLVDSAGARITDQVEMFPGRRGAGRIRNHGESEHRGKSPGFPHRRFRYDRLPHGLVLLFVTIVVAHALCRIWSVGVHLTGR